MTAGEWKTGASHAALAAEFDVSVRTVETWASTASRVIRIAMGDGEELRARLAMMLERHERVAMGGGDVKAATGAVKTLAELMGLMVQKHEVGVVVAQYEQLPRVDKVAWLKERAQKLLAEAERLQSDE